MAPKRKAAVRSTPVPKKQKLDKFEELLVTLGVKVTIDGFVVENIQSFQEQLKKKVAFDDEKKKEFLNLLNAYIGSTTSLIQILRPTSNTMGTVHQISQDSVFRIILNMSVLQADLVEVLLNKLQEVEVSSEQKNIPKLLLNQLRWLDVIEDSAVLNEKLIECLNMPLSSDIKREVIITIPDIIEDEQHEDIIPILMERLDEDREAFVAPVLEALSNLNFAGNSEVTKSVLEKALGLLGSASTSDLPTVLKFLLQFPNETSIPNIVSTIRSDLNIEPIVISASQVKSSALSQKDCEKFIFECLKSGMQFKPEIAKQMLAEITKAEKTTELDFWLLAVLYGIKYKKAMTIIHDKIISGHFTLNMLRLCIRDHSVAMNEFYDVLMSIAQGLLKDVNRNVREFGISIYYHCFLASDNTESKQMVIENQFTHLGSGDSNQIYCSLETLIRLADENPIELRNFSHKLDKVIDFNYETKEQIRKSYELYCLITYDQSESNSAGLISMQKLLAGTENETHLIGITSAIKFLGSSSATNLKQIASNFLTTLGRQERSAKANSFIFDELSTIVSTLDPELRSLISDFFRIFEPFIKDIQEEDSIWMRISTEDESHAIKIKSFAFSDDPLMQDSLIYLPSIYRLQQSVDRFSTEIDDSTLTLGLEMFEESMLDTFSTTATAKEKHAMALCLFHAINWIRELLNTFSPLIERSSETITAALLQRIEHLAKLELDFNGCLTSFEFCPPGHLTTPKPKTKNPFKGKDDNQFVKKKANLEPYRHTLRPLELSTSYLLATSSPLKAKAFYFLLEDFQDKLVTIVKNEEPITPVDELSKLFPLFAGIREHVETMVENLVSSRSEKSSSQGSQENSDLLESEDAPYWEGSIFLSFKCFHLILNCQMLKLASNESYLVKLLQAISKAEPRSLDDMLIDAFENFLTTFSSHDLPIDCEVALINILLSLISDSQTTQKMKLSHLIARILKYYTNPLKKETLNYLLPLYIKNHSKPTEIFRELTAALVEFSGNTSETFKTLTSSTFPTYFATLLNQFCIYAAKVQQHPDTQKRLSYTQACLKYFGQVLKLNIGQEANKIQLKASLTYGRKMFEHINKAMNFFNTQFSKNDKTVLSIIKTLPGITRVLNILCAHAKDKKDTSLSDKVPYVMSAMELLNCKVQELLARNDCQDAITIGNLVPRNIQGDVVQEPDTQASQSSQAEEEPPAKPKKEKKKRARKPKNKKED